MPDAIRIGLIGAGRNTREKHIPGFLALPGIEIVAVCNRSLESGQRVAREFGIPRVTTDVREIVDDPSIDAVCIGTWPYRHCEYTVGSLDAGKHVLVEARMASTASEAREMLSASRRRPDLVAQVVPAPRDFTWGPTIRRLLEDGAVGEVREVHVDLLNGQGINASTPLHWRERSDYSGVNMMSLGLYIEIVHRWIGPTQRVFADGEVFVRERIDLETGTRKTVDIPDSLGVLARLDSGVRVTYRVSAITAQPERSTSISVYGSRGTLHWVADQRVTYAALGEQAQLLTLDPVMVQPWRVEADFVDSIRAGTPVRLTSFEDGERYMRATEAVHRSMLEHRAIDVADV